jgi:putative phosphoesterase
MRVALLSDLHGNELALDAVLADVREQGADQIVCLGDTAALGPRPCAVLARLRDLGCPCVLGNHDAFMLDLDLIHSYNDAPVIVEAATWCQAQLSSADLEFIATFVSKIELDLSSDVRLLLFHGSPRSYMEDILCTTPAEQLDAMLAGQTATVMAGGHTHIPMLRRQRGILLVNPGSVGLSFEQYVAGKTPKLQPYAEWACIEVKRENLSVNLRRVPLDRRSLRLAAQSVDLPFTAWLAAQYA